MLVASRGCFFFLCVVYDITLPCTVSLTVSSPFWCSVREVDNTLTVIIVSVLGGVIGLVIIVMVIKALVVALLHKDDEKK